MLNPAEIEESLDWFKSLPLPPPIQDPSESEKEFSTPPPTNELFDPEIRLPEPAPKKDVLEFFNELLKPAPINESSEPESELLEPAPKVDLGESLRLFNSPPIKIEPSPVKLLPLPPIITLF